jgi:hypothetical protein
VRAHHFNRNVSGISAQETELGRPDDALAVAAQRRVLDAELLQIGFVLR